MDRTVDWTLLAKYLSGECSEGEEDAIKERIHRDPSMRSSLKEAERIWGASRAPSELRDWNVELLWDRVCRGGEPRSEGPGRPGSGGDLSEVHAERGIVVEGPAAAHVGCGGQRLRILGSRCVSLFLRVGDGMVCRV